MEHVVWINPFTEIGFKIGLINNTIGCLEFNGGFSFQVLSSELLKGFNQMQKFAEPLYYVSVFSRTIML